MGICDVIEHMGQAWEMSKNEIKDVFHGIGDIAVGLQLETQGMGLV